MNNNDAEFFDWSPKDMLEIIIDKADDFLIVAETLTRIGISPRRENRLYQSCHILHKQGKYFIVHFKEMFLLDGRASSLQKTDIKRRNTIAQLLSDWGLVEIVDESKIAEQMPMKYIKVISNSDKANWELIPKYSIGNTNASNNNSSRKTDSVAGSGQR